MSNVRSTLAEIITASTRLLEELEKEATRTDDPREQYLKELKNAAMMNGVRVEQLHSVRAFACYYQRHREPFLQMSDSEAYRLVQIGPGALLIHIENAWSKWVELNWPNLPERGVPPASEEE